MELDFLLRHGYAVLFAAVLAEQIGLPVPAAPFLLGAGALAGMRQLQPLPALLVALLASLLSDLLWFEIGRRRGGTVLRLLCRLSLEADPVVIPGALRLDPEELEAGHPAIPREREIVLYCT